MKMPFELILTHTVCGQLQILEESPAFKKRLKAVRKALGYLAQNPKHPSLKTHKHHALSRKFGMEILEAYAENNTPQAYRIFWHYGPAQNAITILAITSHP